MLIGTYELLNAEHLRSSLNEKLKAIKESISVWQDPHPYSDSCRENYVSGVWEHSPDCPSLHDSSRDCDVEEFKRRQDRLRSLSLLPMLTLAFQSPSLANGQRLLDGLAQGPGVYSSRFGHYPFQLG